MAIVTLSTSNSVATSTAVSAAVLTIPAQTGARVSLYGVVCSYSNAPTAATLTISAATAQLFKAFLSLTSGPQRFEFVNFAAETSQAVTLIQSSGGCSAVLNAWWGYV